MTTETMTVHRALVERNTLENRINKSIREGTYCTTNKCGNTKIGGTDLDDYKGIIQGFYDESIDLITRLNAINRAITLSNALTKVKIGDEEYTVAEAITMKNHAMDYYVSLYNEMNHQYRQAQSKINSQNEAALDEADEFVKALYNGKESNITPNDYDDIKNNYLNSHSLELIDPIDIRKKIEILENKVDTFKSEVDAVLSESNALTTITISY